MKNSSVVEICARPSEAVSWRGSQIAISTFEAAALVGEEERARPAFASTFSSLSWSSSREMQDSLRPKTCSVLGLHKYSRRNESEALPKIAPQCLEDEHSTPAKVHAPRLGKLQFYGSGVQFNTLETSRKPNLKRR